MNQKFSKKKIKLLISLVVVFFAALIFLIVFFLKKNMKTADGEEIINVKIAPALMAVPEEPLSLPPIEFSRKQKKNWDEEEIQELYETPTKEEMEDLHKENEKQIKELMEAVP